MKQQQSPELDKGKIKFQELGRPPSIWQRRHNVAWIQHVDQCSQRCMYYLNFSLSALYQAACVNEVFLLYVA